MNSPKNPAGRARPCSLSVLILAMPVTMGSKRLDSISDFNRHGYDLRVTCRCVHVGRIDSKALTAQCVARGVSRQMHAIERRLRCARCGACDVKCGPIER